MKKLFYLLFSCSVTLVSCNKPGCTDVNAINYDSTANDEDGTCQYVPTLSTVPLDVTSSFASSTIQSNRGG